MKPFILNLLRISIYQIIFMRLPDAAACNEAVNLVKKRKMGNLSGYVNGVLRSVVRQKDNIVMPSNKLDNLSVKYSMPKWLIECWSNSFDMDTMEEICQGSLCTPKISICVNLTKTTAQNLQQLLISEGIEVEHTNNDNLLFISKTDDISKSNAFKAGLFHVMDQSAMAACEALSPKPKDNILDLCAAPGGKSFYMAYLMGDNGSIQANDIFQHKIDLMKQSCERLQISCIQLCLEDATVLNDNHIEKWDKVLADVPCSGLGLLSKKPDIKYNKDLHQINDLIAIQRKILSNAAKYVKPNGLICYSTCTISQLENIDNINWFLENTPNFTLVSQKQILPKTGWDGFYIAILKKQ